MYSGCKSSASSKREAKKIISFASFAVICWVPLKNHIFFPSGEVSTFNITITTNIYSHTCIYFIFGLSWLLGNTYTATQNLETKEILYVYESIKLRGTTNLIRKIGKIGKMQCCYSTISKLWWEFYHHDFIPIYGYR